MYSAFHELCTRDICTSNAIERFMSVCLKPGANEECQLNVLSVKRVSSML